MVSTCSSHQQECSGENLDDCEDAEHTLSQEFTKHDDEEEEEFTVEISEEDKNRERKNQEESTDEEMLDESPDSELNDLREGGHNAPEARTFLPDSPVQLVRPDSENHRQLVLIRENVHHLHHIEGAVAVVAVVGKFHSGKSFLLNQLMGKWNGFGIGPSVQPKTMGIWMWGKVKWQDGVDMPCGHTGL